MKPLKEKTSITIDNDILKKLRELAEADDRSLSQYINLILREYIRNTEEEYVLRRVFHRRLQPDRIFSCSYV